MKVYEFWLNSLSQTQTFDELSKSFYDLGSRFVRVAEKGSVYPEFKKDGITPHPKAGELTTGNAVYSISWNDRTHWIQLLIDDNTPPATIILIEDMIATMKDTESIRTYVDDAHNIAPIETPKHFILSEVLEVRRKQKEGWYSP